jgi:hypothetical protein
MQCEIKKRGPEVSNLPRRFPQPRVASAYGYLAKAEVAVDEGGEGKLVVFSASHIDGDSLPSVVIGFGFSHSGVRLNLDPVTLVR